MKRCGTCTEIESEPRLDAKTAPQRVTIARDFTFVRRLTVDPPGTGMSSAPAVCNAGFSEEGLFHVISVNALYYFMNRILEGAGIKWPVRVMYMTDEMRRRYRYTHLWTTISKGIEVS